MLLNLVKKLAVIKGVHQNGFILYFGGFNHLNGYYWIVHYSLFPVLVI